MPDRKLAKEDLRTIKRVFDKLKLPLFLCYGTALGAYRDNDFLPELLFDIDIGTFGTEHKEEIWKTLKEKGFYSRAKKVEIEKYGYLPIERNVKIDLFFFVEVKTENTYKSYAMGDTVCANLPKRYSKLEKIKFLGNSYLIPSPPDKYLEHCYGNWQDKSSRKHGFPNF